MQRITLIVLLTILSIWMSGCQGKIEKIDFFLDDGHLWHDVVLTNKSGKDLHQVNVTVTLIGDKGEQGSEAEQFNIWGDGQQQRISFTMKHSPEKVRKIVLKGDCKEGEIEAYWVPKAIKN
jgi:hypothetical protein